MYKIYQVEMGETLNSIADKLKTDVDTLMQINGIKTDMMLRPGSYLIVPVLDDRFIKYMVAKGDTIYSISKRYNVDPTLLYKINGLNEDDYIYPNQELLIPNPEYKFYITKDNDTLSDVANRLNENVIDLVSKNETLYLTPDQLLIYK